jgi:hypothetical protein
LCATASTRPGISDGRSVSNFADSGLASETGGWLPAVENAWATLFSMNPNVTASDRPAAVRTRRTRLSRGIRTSAGGAGAVTTGKVAASLSNP